jgi:hypothetical protein
MKAFMILTENDEITEEMVRKGVAEFAPWQRNAETLVKEV